LQKCVRELKIDQDKIRYVWIYANAILHNSLCFKQCTYSTSYRVNADARPRVNQHFNGLFWGSL